MVTGSTNAPLVVFAWDAGDPDFFQQWVKDGTLPNLATVMQRGCWSLIPEPKLFTDFGQWTSLLSGVPRHRSGYYYFRQLVPGTYDLRAFSHLDADAVPFWAYLRGTGKRAAIIDAPESAPVPGLDGIQLSQLAERHLPQRKIPLFAGPPEVLEEARRVFGKQIRIIDFDPDSTPREDAKILRLMLDRIERKGRLSRHFCGKTRYDLIVIGYFEGHDASHRFWDYRAGEPGQQAGEVFGLTHGIRHVYQAIDRELGLLLASLPVEATVVILSCYGMGHGFPSSGLIDSFCHELGYQVPRPGRVGLNPLDLLRRMVPQPWRLALSGHLPVTVQERLLANQFRNCTDWARTQAFGIPSAHSSFVRVNLRNREPEGVICTDKEYDSLMDRLETDLASLIDPVTGEAAVELIERTCQLSNGAPPIKIPDLFVRWKGHRRFVDRLIHPQAEVRQKPAWYHRGSEHSGLGFFAATGPSITPRGRLDDVTSLDVAPTFLALMGQPIPPEVGGTPIPSLVPKGSFARTGTHTQA